MHKKTKRSIFKTGLPWLWISIAIIAFDRYTKWWMVENLNVLEPFRIFSFFNFTLAFNKGAAFSFLHSASGWQNIFLSGLALIISGCIVWWLYQSKYKERWFNIALSLILGGALGNAFDRKIYGYVVDFFDFHINDWHFAIFNLADSAICIGTFMLICHWLFLEKNKN